MAENSNIEWTHHTFNPWSGCTKVSPACDHCYAEVNYSVKMRGVKWGKYGNRIIASDSMWKQPLIWNRKAEAEGVRKRVFCASLADVFEGEETMPAEAVDPIREARFRLLSLIHKTKNLNWLLLTKRPENVKRILLDTVAGQWADPADITDRVHAWMSGESVFSNVWIGTTVENQKYADERIPELLKIPAAVRFLSCEPLLGPIDLSHYISLDEKNGTYEFLEASGWGYDEWSGGFTGPNSFRDSTYAPEPGIHLVIAGGESGGIKARPMHPDWPRSLRDQCVAAGVPFFFKQWGEYVPDSNAGSQTIDFLGKFQPLFPSPRDGAVEPRAAVRRIGKKQAGRLLDGRTWDEMPNDKSLPAHAL